MQKNYSFQSVNLFHLLRLCSKTLSFSTAQYNTHPYWSINIYYRFTCPQSYRRFDLICNNFETLYFNITPQNGWSKLKYIHFPYAAPKQKLWTGTVILLDFLYNVLNYITKLFILQGRKLWRISLLIIWITYIFNIQDVSRL